MLRSKYYYTLTNLSNGTLVSDYKIVRSLDGNAVGFKDGDVFYSDNSEMVNFAKQFSFKIGVITEDFPTEEEKEAAYILLSGILEGEHWKEVISNTLKKLEKPKAFERFQKIINIMIKKGVI